MGGSPTLGFHRLTTRFLLIALGLFALVAAVSTISFFLGVQGIVEGLARSYALERASGEQARLGDLLSREATLSSRLAQSPTLREWMVDPGNATLKDRAFTELKYYSSAFLDRNYFVVTDATRAYYNKPADSPLVETVLDRNNPADVWYFNTVAAGKDVTFNLDFNRLIGAAKVWINCLVRVNGRVVGLTGTGIDISDLVSHLVRAEGDGTTSMLTDNQGVITAYHDVAYLTHNANERAAGKKITVFDLASSTRDRGKLERMFADARDGKSVAEVVRLSGHDRLTVMAPIPDIGWMAIVAVDTSTFVSPTNFVPLFALLIFSILVALGILAALIERVVLRPLSALTSSAHQIAGGDYDLALRFDRNDEIGALSVAFTEMARQVQRYTGNLEQLVAERTTELTAVNGELAASNRKVMESIRFARMIQDGMMAPEPMLDELFASHSFFRRQRDVVGGDFLFVRKIEEGFLCAVVDCEGHGVPGALMTVMADSFLQLITSRMAGDDPAAILDAFEREVRESLRQDSGNYRTQGGMDIALCSCFPDERRLVYAGAGMPLYVLEKDGSVSTVRDRPRAIGYRRGTSTFQNHVFDTEGRAFFMCTDGYVDQPGVESTRAFGTGRLSGLISRCACRPLDAQCPAWEAEFDGYRGSQPQRDDALAFGFRLERASEGQLKSVGDEHG